MANRRYIDFPIASTVGDSDIILIWQSGANKQTTKATFLSGLPENLDELNDVAISGLTNGQILRYDSVTGKWENTDQGNLDLNDLNDVSIVSPSNGQVLVYNSSTSKWENSSGGFVPYVGAVTTVDLGAQGLRAGYVRFDTTVAGVPNEQGLMFWDADDETVDIILNGYTMKIGEDLFYPVKNQTGSTIAKGVAVRFNGTVGNSGRLLIAPFIADGSVASSRFMGVTAEEILNGEDGKVLYFGRIRGINTNAFNEGDILYASTTVAGGYQTAIPVAPNNIVQVAAVVTKSATVGTIFVRPTLGSNINKDEGVKITSVANKNLLQYQSGTSLWENKSLAQVLGGTSLQFVKGDGSLDSNTYGTGTVTSVGLSSATSGVTIGSTPVTTSGTITLAIATASGSQNGLLSSTDWTTFNGKQNALTNPVTGTGTTNYLPKFTGASTIGNSALQETNGNLGLGVTPPAWAAFKAINIGGASVSANGTTSIILSRNWYYDGGERYFENGTAQRLELVGNGFYFQNATTNSSGAGAALTWGSPMTLNSLGNLLIGTTTDNGARLQVSGTATFSSSVTASIFDSTSNAFRFSGSNALSLVSLSGQSVVKINAAGYWGSQIVGANDQGILVNNVGNVGIGTSSPSALLTVSSIGFDDTTLRVEQLRGGYASAINLVGTNDAGAGFNRIASQTNGGTTHWQIGGGGTTNTIAFLTGGTERMRIDSNGTMILGGTSTTGTAGTGSGRGNLILAGSTSNKLTFNNNSTTVNGYVYSDGSELQISSGAGYMNFYSGNTERMRITSGGNVLIGTTTDGGAKLQVRQTGVAWASIFNHTNAGTQFYMDIQYNGSQIGSIMGNNTAASFNTSSDYRLKTDLKDYNGLDLVSKIKTYDFEWKTDKSRSFGVIAHELQEVISYAVTGKKDGVFIQGVDYSKLVPIMVKAIQELKQEIDILKN